MISSSWFIVSASALLNGIAAQSMNDNHFNSGGGRAVDLEDILPTEYDCVRPPIYQGKAAVVDIRIYLLNIRDFDDSEMAFTADIFMQQFWEDRRLVFPPWVNTSKVVLNIKWLDNIWFPNIYFQNAIDSHVDKLIVPNLYMWLQSNGTVTFYGRYTLKISCDMDLRNFPHDTQTCQMKMLSLSYTYKEMVLLWKKDQGFRLSRDVILPQFEMLNLTNFEGFKDTSVGKVSYLTAQMQFKRREGYYVINVYIPTILIVLMSMLTFWIPPDAVPARVTLGVTSLLTMITKQYQAAMPNVSYIVALNVWLSCCIAFVFCSLLEYAVVIALVTKFRRQEDGPKPFVTDKNKRKIRTLYAHGAWQKRIEETKKKLDMSEIPHLIDVISRILFPIIFVVISIVYCEMYTRN